MDKVERLIEKLKKGDIDSVEALVVIGDERAIEPLRQIFVDGEGEYEDNMRSVAAMALGKIRNSQGIGTLIYELLDSDAPSDVRFWAAEAIGKASVINRNTESILLAAYINDKDERVRNSALESLVEITNHPPEYWVRFLQD